MKISNKKGVTLIEVVIAFAIFLIIIGGILVSISSLYSNLKLSEMQNTAVNIATYSAEYIRSRNLTQDNRAGHSISSFGYDDQHDFPGLTNIFDVLWISVFPLTTHTNSASDSYVINTNPASPQDTYNNSPESFYFSLQGYTSLGKPDPNLQSGGYGHIVCKDMAVYNGGVHTNNALVIEFPDADIACFQAGPTYIPLIYTSDRNKTDKTKPDYCPFYTNDIRLKSRTQDYRGFRVLTKIVARKKDPSVTHVQYFDVDITVFFMFKGQERSYNVKEKIATY